MRKLTLRLLLIMFCLVSTYSLSAQTARIQVIHNSADPGASQVDVFLNETKALENFAFRTATPFIDVPANTPIIVGIAPPNSTDSSQALAQFEYNLVEDETYIIVANGVLDPSAFATNPDNESTAFNLFVFGAAKEEADEVDEVDVLAFHGSTDAPTVSVYAEDETDGIELIPELTYGDFAGYLTLPDEDAVLEVRDENGNTSLFAYEAPLSTLGGNSITVIASGFLIPGDNQGGDDFGLFVVPADAPAGVDIIDFIPLTSPVTEAHLVHNSPDVSVASLDLYVNGELFFSDFDYRTSTGFVEVPASVNLTVGAAPSGSDGPEDIIATFDAKFHSEKDYYTIAAGVVDPNDFDANPDGIGIELGLFNFDMAKTTSDDSDEVDLALFHGITNFGTVATYVGGGFDIDLAIDPLSFGDFSEYATLEAEDVILQVTDEDGDESFLAYEAPLSAFGGTAFMAIASGIVGEDGGVLLIDPNGGDLIPLNSPTASVQIIHNAADPTVESVDIYLGEEMILEDFAFRTASPFVAVDAAVSSTVTVVPTGGDIADGITEESFFEAGETYIAIANGVLSPMDFEDNPDGFDIAFDLFPYWPARTEADDENEVDVLVFHGATDAPTVSVWARGVDDALIQSLIYGDFADDYLSLAADDYILEVRDEAGENVVAAYEAPLSAFEGAALTVVASGFLAPEANENGPAFGLWVASADGGALIELTPAVENSLEENGNANLIGNFPNPFDQTTTVNYSLEKGANVSFVLYDNAGRVIRQEDAGMQAAGQHQFDLDRNGLTSGVYHLRMMADDYVGNLKLIVK